MVRAEAPPRVGRTWRVRADEDGAVVATHRSKRLRVFGIRCTTPMSITGGTAWGGCTPGRDLGGEVAGLGFMVELG